MTYLDIETAFPNSHPKLGEEEIWKYVPGYGGKYEVSSFGNVRSNSIKKKGKMLRPYIQSGSKGGYKRYYFLMDGVTQVVSGHVIGARLFVPNPLNLPEVNHIDNDRTNNYYGNFEWVTRKGNCEHAANQKRYRTPRGEAQHFAKLTEDDVRVIRASSDGVTELANRYGVDRDTIYSVLKKLTWKHVA